MVRIWYLPLVDLSRSKKNNSFYYNGTLKTRAVFRGRKFFQQKLLLILQALKLTSFSNFFIFVGYNSLLTSIWSVLMCLNCQKCWFWKIRESFFLFFFGGKIYYIYVQLSGAKCVSFWKFSALQWFCMSILTTVFVMKLGLKIFLVLQIWRHWYTLPQRFQPLFWSNITNLIVFWSLVVRTWQLPLVNL